MLGDVLCLSHLRWGFVYQRPNHLMSRWARDHRVFFFEEPVFDADSPRIVVTEVLPNLRVVVPHLRPGEPRAEVLRRQREMLDGLCAQFRIRAPVVWFTTPMALAFAEHTSAKVVVYDCMDELSAFDGAPPELRLEERRLFARADLVFTGGHSLYEAKRAHHGRVHVFPSSVDAAHFAASRKAGLREPEDQRAVPRPRLGFFGVVDERMDRELLALVADTKPDWQIVVIGPVVKIDPGSLPRRRNIHYLGPKRYEDLPSYIAGWDVAIVPFARNEATRFISPTKTLEYLAAGTPVVSTPIRDVVRPYGERGLVRVGAGKEFVRQVDLALRERGTAAEASRRRAALDWVASTSWDRTWEGMQALVVDAVAQRCSVA
jgi:glycosyltransferase involved in cell wall biosynthesis